MIVTTDRQSIFDLALQYYGSIEAAFDIASANGLSVTDDVEVGTELTEPTSVTLVNSDIVTYYSVNSIQPATSDNLILATGIGYMEIESTFTIGADTGINYMAIELDFIVE